MVLCLSSDLTPSLFQEPTWLDQFSNVECHSRKEYHIHRSQGLCTLVLWRMHDMSLASGIAQRSSTAPASSSAPYEASPFFGTYLKHLMLAERKIPLQQWTWKCPRESRWRQRQQSAPSIPHCQLVETQPRHVRCLLASYANKGRN